VLHPLFVVAICFFPDRTLRGVVRNDKFYGCFSTILPGKLSRPLSTYRGTYYLFMFMLLLFFMLALCSDALFESRILSTCFPKAKLYTRHLPPITFCLLFELPLRVVGIFRLLELFYLIGLGSYYMLYFMDISCWRYSWLTIMLIT
jgi:hypothetical protein